MTFAERLSQELKFKGSNANQLAVYLGVSASTPNKWVNGLAVPSCDTALKIAKYLNVSLEWLISGEVEESAPTEKKSAPATIENEIFQRIEYLLIIQKLKKTELLHASGISTETFNAMCCGLKATEKSWNKMAEFLKVPVEYLLTGNNSPRQIPQTEQEKEDQKIIENINILNPEDREELLNILNMKLKKYASPVTAENIG